MTSSSALFVLYHELFCYMSQDHNYSMLEYAEENDSILFKTDPNDCLN